VVEAGLAAEDVHTAEADQEPGPEVAGVPEGLEVGPKVELLSNENDHTLEAEVQAEVDDLTPEVEAEDDHTPDRVRGNEILRIKKRTEKHVFDNLKL